MSVAIIQGASGGQGLALTAHILKHTSLRVYALTHGKGDSIRSSTEKSDRLTVIDGVDVREERALENAAKTVREREGKAAVRLIACLGGVVRHLCSRPVPRRGRSLTVQLTPEKSLGGINASDSLAQFQINAIGHLLTYKHFVPLLPSKKEWHDVASWKSADNDPARGLVSPSNSLCWSQSARVGSISDNEKGGWYSYRASKAALNQLIRTLDHEVS
jgi:NAD(P)-dependent dehydrogenase (short-subunit alcohol dehydrogenase family)